MAQDFIEDLAMNFELQQQVELVEGPFEVRIDYLLHDVDAGVYDLFEIKSGSSVRKEHEYDLTFQALVCNANLPMRDFYIVFVNVESY